MFSPWPWNPPNLQGPKEGINKSPPLSKEVVEDNHINVVSEEEEEFIEVMPKGTPPGNHEVGVDKQAPRERAKRTNRKPLSTTTNYHPTDYMKNRVQASRFYLVLLLFYFLVDSHAVPYPSNSRSQSRSNQHNRNNRNNRPFGRTSSRNTRAGNNATPRRHNNDASVLSLLRPATPYTSMITFRTTPLYEDDYFESLKSGDSMTFTSTIGNQNFKAYISLLYSGDSLPCVVHIMNMIGHFEAMEWIDLNLVEVVAARLQLFKRSLQGPALENWREANRICLERAQRTGANVVVNFNDLLREWKLQCGLDERSAYKILTYLREQPKPGWMRFDQYYKFITIADRVRINCVGTPAELVPLQEEEIIELVRKNVPLAWRIRFDDRYPDREEHTVTLIVGYFRDLQNQEQALRHVSSMQMSNRRDQRSHQGNPSNWRPRHQTQHPSSRQHFPSQGNRFGNTQSQQQRNTPRNNAPRYGQPGYRYNNGRPDRQGSTSGGNRVSFATEEEDNNEEAIEEETEEVFDQDNQGEDDWNEDDFQDFGDDETLEDQQLEDEAEFYDCRQQEYYYDDNDYGYEGEDFYFIEDSGPPTHPMEQGIDTMNTTSEDTASVTHVSATETEQSDNSSWWDFFDDDSTIQMYFADLTLATGLPQSPMNLTEITMEMQQLLNNSECDDHSTEDDKKPAALPPNNPSTASAVQPEMSRNSPPPNPPYRPLTPSVKQQDPSFHPSPILKQNPRANYAKDPNTLPADPPSTASSSSPRQSNMPSFKPSSSPSPRPSVIPSVGPTSSPSTRPNDFPPHYYPVPTPTFNMPTIETDGDYPWNNLRVPFAITDPVSTEPMRLAAEIDAYVNEVILLEATNTLATTSITTATPVPIPTTAPKEQPAERPYADLLCGILQPARNHPLAKKWAPEPVKRSVVKGSKLSVTRMLPLIVPRDVPVCIPTIIPSVTPLLNPPTPPPRDNNFTSTGDGGYSNNKGIGKQADDSSTPPFNVNLSDSINTADNFEIPPFPAPVGLHFHPGELNIPSNISMDGFVPSTINLTCFEHDFEEESYVISSDWSTSNTSGTWTVEDIEHLHSSLFSESNTSQPPNTGLGCRNSSDTESSNPDDDYDDADSEDIYFFPRHSSYQNHWNPVHGCFILQTEEINQNKTPTNHSSYALGPRGRTPVPSTKILRDEDRVPQTLIIPMEDYCKNQNAYRFGGGDFMLRTLCDSGSSGNVIGANLLKPGWEKHAEKSVCTWKTGAGTFQTKHQITITCKFPAFSSNRQVKITFKVHPNYISQNFDCIIGCPTMVKMKMNIDFIKGELNWDGISSPMWPRRAKQHEQIWRCYSVHKEPEAIQQLQSRVFRMIEASYEKLHNLKTLSLEELHKLLKEYEELFDGTLGTITGVPKANLEVNSPLPQTRRKEYPIPFANRPAATSEIQRFVRRAILRKVKECDFCSPSFWVPKPDGTGRLVTDFHVLNESLRRRPHPPRTIDDILFDFHEMHYVAAIDLNQGYYHMQLNQNQNQNQKSQRQLYAYQKLGMGLSTAPDIFQGTMNHIFDDLKYVICYLDDILVVQKKEPQMSEQIAWLEHVHQLKEVPKQLLQRNIKVNHCKSYFRATKTFMQQKPIILDSSYLAKAFVQIQRRHKASYPLQIQQKGVMCILGMINFYKQFLPWKSHTMAPITDLLKKDTKFSWTDKHRAAFKTILLEFANVIMLLSYPNFKIPFDTFTDASDLQLGAVITQNGKPLAFFSRTLSETQHKYCTTRCELLAIVEVLKKYRDILWGHEVNVYTDHINLTYNDSTSPAAARWKLLTKMPTKMPSKMPTKIPFQPSQSPGQPSTTTPAN